MPRRCGLGCTPTRDVLHVFPNPHKFPEQFKAWVRIVSGQEECNFDYKKMRICDRHFTDRDRNRNNRLNALAVPSLFLSEHHVVHTPNEPSVSTSFMSTSKTYDYLQGSDNCQLLSDKIADESMEKNSLKMPQICNIQQLASSVSQEISHDPMLEHNYSKPSVKMAIVKGLKKISVMKSKKCVIYERNIKNLRRHVCRLRKRMGDLKSRLENAEKLFGKSDFQKLVKDMTPASKLFTKMQYFQVKKKAKGRRFTIEEKVLSLSLYKRSPKCYNLMSKYFVLPSTKSLKRLLSQIRLGPGINQIIFDKLAKTVSNLDTEDKLCTLMFDEMSITPQIQYDAPNDELKGFSCHGKNLIANHALVFMIRGIRKQFKQPVAYFFTNSLSKIQLKTLIKDVIKKVQESGLIILCTVCDQSTVNVGAIEDLIKETKTKYLKKGKEMHYDFFEAYGKKIIPLYDVPHLLKGLRNNLLNKPMSYIDYEDDNRLKIVVWEYFQQLYDADRSYGELRGLQKLTEEHINPAKIKKMRVKIAAQIFSHSVAVTTEHLTARGNLPQECRALIPITLLIDNLFDSLNANSFQTPNGKIYKGPVRRNSPHHQLWQKAKKYLNTVKFHASKKVGNKIRKFEIVVPSVTNFIKTIEGIQQLWKTLSQKYSFDSMFTRHFNQDPVENFFGNIRNCGARNIAPNVIGFESAFKTILLNNLNTCHSAQANCEYDNINYLQTFNFFTTETLTVPQINVSEEKKITLRDEVLNDVKVPNDLGQRNYVCGWVLRKCLKNIIKNCKSCRKCVLGSKNAENSYIAAKEYFLDKEWLCYPSTQLVECFHSIQSICVSHLKRDVLKTGIKKEIKTVIEIFVKYPFKCETHKDNLKEYFTDVTINIIIYSWCKSINRILSGKLTFDGEDEMKIYAQNYYNKHRHNKCNK